MSRQQHNPELMDLLKRSLIEDAPTGDITSTMFIPQPCDAVAEVIAKDTGIFFGEAIVRGIFSLFKETFTITFFKLDGDVVQSGEKVCRIEGPLHPILKCERTLLNIIQRLSGISTKTRQFVEALNNPKIKVLDTRKTTPTLRFLEKDAVVAGGGYNHRQNLSDMVLIKENHLAALAKLKQLSEFPNLLASFKSKYPEIKVEVEIEAPEQLVEMDLSMVDYILLDNFTIPMIEKAIQYHQDTGSHAELEISGNVSLSTIAQYRHLDVHRISVGSLTHSVKALDLSLLIH